MKKFKSKKHKKRNFKTYLFIVIVSFLLSTFLFNKKNTEMVIFFSLNNITNKITESFDKLFNNFSRPENLIFSSLNKTVEKEDLSVFMNTDDNYNYENDNTSYVEDPNPIKIEKPIVYVYNTHQLEEYSSVMKNDYNIRPNVLMASYILKEKLNEQNIPTLVETANIKEYLDRNNLKYKYSYKASRYFLKTAVNKNKSLKYFIDLHRDSVKKEVTTLKKDDKSYAKVMFIVGLEHKNYKKNLALAEDINYALSMKLPGISRGVLKKSGTNVNGIYNQDINSNVLLIELGGVDNSIEEVNNTIEVLSIVLSEYIRR